MIGITPVLLVSYVALERCEKGSKMQSFEAKIYASRNALVLGDTNARVDACGDISLSAVKMSCSS
jgi:hypothetical protein